MLIKIKTCTYLFSCFQEYSIRMTAKGKNIIKKCVSHSYADKKTNKNKNKFHEINTNKKKYSKNLKKPTL